MPDLDSTVTDSAASASSTPASPPSASSASASPASLTTDGSSTPGAAPLSLDTLRTLAASFDADPNAVRMQNAVTRAGLEQVAVNHARQVSIPRTVSYRVDDWAVTNQQKSGRCWLFAALNLIRADTRTVLGVKQFEFSQNHAMFWDKVERVNFFLADVIATADQPVDDRVVAYLLATVLGDGGQWDMAVNVFSKHGVVPKEVMPETESSANTASMNRTLRTLLRKAARELRDLVAAGADAEQIDAARERVVADAYRILATHLGTPPAEFDWSWRDDEGRFHRAGRLTPQEFYDRFVRLPLDEYVCLVDDPRAEHPKGGMLTIDHLGNVIGGRPIRYLNAPIELMKRTARDAIIAGEPVWFGCDVSQQLLRKEGLWAADLLDYSGVYGVDLATGKEHRVRYGDSLMTHAMLLTGVDVVEPDSVTGSTPAPGAASTNGASSANAAASTNGHAGPTAAPRSSSGADLGVRRWRVENSWGDENGDKGFYTMDDSWFDEYVFEVVVRISSLPAEYQAALTTEPLHLPPWDPMGALALAR